MSEVEGEQLERPPRPPIMRFLLVRHGETEDTSYFPDFSGHSDPPLSPTGRQQAEAIARELAETPGLSLAAIYTSPLKAAYETAATLAELLETAPPDITGSLATISPEDLPGGHAGLQALEAIQQRVWSMVEAVREQHGPESTVLLLSHELPIRALICKALAIPLAETDRFQVDQGSLSIIEFRGQRTLLARLNDLCHQ